LSNPFPDYYGEFIAVSRYAKWRDADKRRESWGETVDRLCEYYAKKVGFTEEDTDQYTELYNAIYNLEVMPSMRSLMAAGPALDRCNVAAFNCAYLPVDSPRSFDESMYILMCGTGVGFSVEEKYVHRLPVVAEEFTASESVIVVGDSKEGWARAFRQLVSALYSGDVPRWDVSGVRPAGARLKTFGGRASGPQPLVDLFKFTIDTFKRAAGRRLTTLECHDIMCKIGDIVVVGGVRRSAMISLSDVTDDRMRVAKTGEWWNGFGHRRLANNSAVYERRKPDMDLFMKEWKALYDSKSGERGLFSRYACQAIAKRNGRRDANHDFGTNPCSEIILRPYEFCNLTEIVVRSDDTFESLSRKARIASILGTIQSTFTDFKYLRKIWADNCNEERLLGVSLTGVCDNVKLLTAENLGALKQVVIDTNKEWAERLGIPQSVATTCVKPSGTVSQLVGSASGLHPSFSSHYIRTVRADNKDPLTAFLTDAGVPCEADQMASASTSIFSFPIKVPEGSVTRDQMTAIDQLELWKLLQDHWCEHKPSCTVYVRDDEWMKVGSWVYDHFDELSGVSFLPYDNGTYKQAPYTEVTADIYDEAKAAMPDTIDWSGLAAYETEDNTTGSQELACSSGECSIMTIGTISDG
jgi:ribonucleoside-diphosphate reductase alpha chain